ncbi:TPA: hypothetical protein DCG82_00290 [candidate division WOR-3]|nr:hypothetical protein [candidate division WOR-3 bacterium]
MEDGYETLKVKLPAALTCIKELNEPRLPSLRGKIRAKKEEIPVWDANFLGIDLSKCGFKGSPTWVTKAFTPTIQKENIIFSDDNQEKNVENLINELKKKSII